MPKYLYLKVTKRLGMYTYRTFTTFRNRFDCHILTGIEIFEDIPKNIAELSNEFLNFIDCGPLAKIILACVAGGIRGHKGGSLKYRLPKN